MPKAKHTVEHHVRPVCLTSHSCFLHIHTWCSLLCESSQVMYVQVIDCMFTLQPEQNSDHSHSFRYNRLISGLSESSQSEVSNGLGWMEWNGMKWRINVVRSTSTSTSYSWRFHSWQWHMKTTLGSVEEIHSMLHSFIHSIIPFSERKYIIYIAQDKRMRH